MDRPGYRRGHAPQPRSSSLLEANEDVGSPCKPRLALQIRLPFHDEHIALGRVRARTETSGLTEAVELVQVDYECGGKLERRVQVAGWGGSIVGDIDRKNRMQTTAREDARRICRHAEERKERDGRLAPGRRDSLAGPYLPIPTVRASRSIL